MQLIVKYYTFTSILDCCERLHHISDSDGADIRLSEPNPSIFEASESDFSESKIHIRPFPNPAFSDFWVNFMQNFEISDFLGIRLRLLCTYLILSESDLLLSEDICTYLTFWYLLHH